MSSRTDVTRIFSSIDRGDASAAAELLPILYEELRELASRRKAGEGSGQTLQATALLLHHRAELLGALSRIGEALVGARPRDLSRTPRVRNQHVDE